MKNKILKTLKLIIPILIGVYLTWYFYSNSTPSEKESFVNAFKEANYGWIFLSLVVAFLSHLSRAYRWKFLLEPMGVNPKLNVMYNSVMIGYIINLTIPRSGELARAAYFSKYENIPADKAFGTIVVERVIDLIMFGGLFFVALLLQADQEKFNQIREMSNSGSVSSWVFPAVVTTGLLCLIIVFAVKKIREKAIEFIKGIIEGCLSIFKLKRKVAFIAHTFFIWGAYILMLWLTALALPNMENIPFNAVFACFVAGSVAMSATPGGIGLYPIMVAATLIQLYGYESETAKSFSMLMWAVQTIFIVFLGLISLIAIQKNKPIGKS